MATPAVFLDRDGVLNVDAGYVSRVEEFCFVEGVFASLRAMQAAGFRLIVVTNQSGIGRGYFTEEQFRRLTDWMMLRLMQQQVQLTAVYHCPHAPQASCECRKPAPGLILRAAEDHGIDLRRSWLIGDRDRDIAAAQRAGVANTILLCERNEQEQGNGNDLGEPVVPTFRCATLLEASRRILAGSAY